MDKMKLMPMTDFVLEQTTLWLKGQVTDDSVIGFCRNYAEFLTAQLALWMFVPCDDSGNVLQDPGLIPSAELKAYREAKDRCLFEGFDITSTVNYLVFTSDDDETSWLGKFNDDLGFEFFFDDIEDLLIRWFISPQLTPAALKQIFG